MAEKKPAVLMDLPSKPADLNKMFNDAATMKRKLQAIQKKARAVKGADMSSKRARDAVKTMAATVARTKTLIDGAGKEANAKLREQIDAVDEIRRVVRETLDNLRDEIRQPLTDWENAEAARKARITSEIDGIKLHGMSALDSSNAIAAAISDRESINPDDEKWGEFGLDAAAAIEASLYALRPMLEAAKKRELDEAELARLKQEAAEREAREAEERAAREAEAEALRAAEAERLNEERRKREAAEKKLQEERAEKQRKEDIERRIKEEREQAELRAKQDAEAERIRLEEQVKQKERERAEAVEAERQRVAREKAEEDEKRRKREASKRRRATARKAMLEAIAALDEQTPEAIVDAIFAGDVPNVQLVL